MKITFPDKTAKQIVKDCGNKLGNGKLLYDTDWYENEPFYTKEKCRPRTVEVSIGNYGDSFIDCDETLKGSMLSFAELLYVMTQGGLPELKGFKYSWTSSRASDGDFVLAGVFVADGGYVGGHGPGGSDSYLGCAFSVEKIEPSKIESLNGDKAASLEARVSELERKMNGIHIDFN